jgi:two-component system, OmpR family, response regulator
MTDSNDALPGEALPGAEGTAAADPTPPAPAAPRVLVIDADPALTALLDEWLCALGWSVVHGTGGKSVGESVDNDGGRFDLLIVDVPYPRQGGVDLVARVAARHPKTPILALSSTFFAGIECHGPVAHALGVDCVLAKPARREALTNAVRNLLPS